MNRDDFVRIKKEASKSVAEAAITSPGVYPVYGEWRDAEKALKLAQARRDRAAREWAQFIADALDDPNFRAIAEARGLIPAAPQEPKP